jgi:hypothetical protein
MSTTFTDKVRILSDLWVYYAEDEDLAPFISEHELFLFTAFMVEDDIILPDGISERLEELLEDGFGMFLEFVGVSDEGYETVKDITGKDTPLDNL